VSKTDEKHRVLEYGRPRSRGSASSSSLRVIELLVGMCFAGALYFVLMTFIYVNMPPGATAQYVRYQQDVAARVATQPSYVAPPFVGPRYVKRSAFRTITLYIAVGFIVAAGGLIWVDRRWARRKG
jgi:hypothetical protein